MKAWIYNGVEITSIDQFPKGTIGFVYKIINLKTDQFYVGKKSLSSTRTKALTKKELAEITDKRKSKKKKVVKESDWMTYCGSNDELKKDIKKHGIHNFHREIQCFCSNKTELTYCEVKYQFEYSVLEVDNSYNGNILGRFWKNSIK